MMSIQDVILFFCMYVEETLAFGSIHTYVFVN